MPYRATLSQDFPGAVAYERYLARVSRAVVPLGFDREHSFAAVSVCRDELAQPLLHAVPRRWDQPFNLGGLGTIPSLGRTGWRAALSHVPDDTRGHLIVFGLPHIGIDPEGHIGESLRRHQHCVTPTCGAMVALLGSLGRPAGRAAAAGVGGPRGRAAPRRDRRARRSPARGPARTDAAGRQGGRHELCRRTRWF